MPSRGKLESAEDWVFVFEAMESHIFGSCDFTPGGLFTGVVNCFSNPDVRLVPWVHVFPEWYARFSFVFATWENQHLWRASSELRWAALCGLHQWHMVASPADPRISGLCFGTGARSWMWRDGNWNQLFWASPQKLRWTTIQLQFSISKRTNMEQSWTLTFWIWRLQTLFINVSRIPAFSHLRDSGKDRMTFAFRPSMQECDSFLWPNAERQSWSVSLEPDKIPWS